MAHSGFATCINLAAKPRHREAVCISSGVAERELRVKDCLDNHDKPPKSARMALIKSKQRVADLGGVFTPPWMVEAMLDRVKVLQRKLAAADQQHAPQEAA